MKETIILSDINERELLRSLSCQNKASFNVRAFNEVALAKEALLRSGKVIKEKEINSISQICIIYKLLKKIEYFKDSTFEDAKHIVYSLNYARELCRNDEDTKMVKVFSDGEFKEKNKAILELYKAYKEELMNNNLVDSIDIINRAINECEGMDADFVVFKETHLKPLSEELIKKLSNNNYQEKTIYEYASLPKKELKDVEYANAYGAVNEVEHIIATIAKKKIPYEDCVIALLDNSYLNHFLAYRDAHNVPMTFGTGIDITNTNSYKILTLLDRWNKGYNGTNAFKDLIYAPEFDTEKFFNNVGLINKKPREEDEIISTIGYLRLSTETNSRLEEYKNVLDKKKDNHYPIIEAINNELIKGYKYLIETYTKIDNELENKAIKKITSTIDEYENNMNKINLEDIISLLSNTKIGREYSNKQKIHLTNIKGALGCLRKHLFICGLNAKYFPGSPKEDYLLLDSDLKRFNEDKVEDSNSKIINNKELLMNLIDLASSFDSHLHLSYSGYNLADLKVDNPSSVLFEVFKKEHGLDATVDDFNIAIGEQHKYFDEDITNVKNIGQKYIEGINIQKEDDNLNYGGKAILNYKISPSAADIFFSCPKRFYLTKILGVVEPQDDDPFNTLLANDEGTLIHECMEDYGNNPSWTLEEHLANAEKKLDDYFKKRIPIHDKEMNKIKNSFLNVARIGYETNPTPARDVVASEKWLEGEGFDTGLRFGGIVDRIERLPNGKCQIIDYKTYRNIKNNEDDIDTCFQVVLYAYLLEQSGEKVDSCEYRYLRFNKQVKCVYNDNMKELLHQKLNEIKEALDTGNFPLISDEENCKYCKLGNICGKRNLEESSEEDIDE